MLQYKNILIHSLVNIGDVVLSTSAVALLKQMCPDAKITMMVKPSAAEVVYNNSIIDEVIVFKYKEKQKSWRSMWELLQDIRGRNFDLVITFDRKLRPALLTLFAGIPVRVAPDRIFDNKASWVTKFYTDIIHTSDDFLNTHQSQLFQDIIKGFFKQQGSGRPVIGTITDEHKIKAERLLQSLPKAKKRIALCVKGTYYLKNWPQEKFVELVQELSNRYEAAFYIVGAPEDYTYAEEVITKSSVPIANFCGRTNLIDYAALMEMSDLLITIDTGGMHIAATTSVPIVGIFRCVSEKRWYPLNERGVAVTIRKQDCPQVESPENCPMKYCVEEISVSQVLNEVNKLLDK